MSDKNTSILDLFFIDFFIFQFQFFTNMLLNTIYQDFKKCECSILFDEFSTEILF